jgi:hypothetical protein
VSSALSFSHVIARCRKHRQCLDHAAEARLLAQETTDPQRQVEFFDMERRWLRLAESYRLVEQLDRFITDTKRERIKMLLE